MFAQLECANPLKLLLSKVLLTQYVPRKCQKGLSAIYLRIV